MKLKRFDYDETGVFRVAVTEKILGYDVMLQDIARTPSRGIGKAKKLTRQLRKMKAGIQ